MTVYGGVRIAVALVALPSATVFVLNPTVLVRNVMVPEAPVAGVTPFGHHRAGKDCPQLESWATTHWFPQPRREH